MTANEQLSRPDAWQAGDQVTRGIGRTTLTRSEDGVWHWPNSDRTLSDWFINTWLDDGTVTVCHLSSRDEHTPCPTCQGPRRETTGMVCQTCGTDYAAVSKPPHSPNCGVLRCGTCEREDPAV